MNQPLGANGAQPADSHTAMILQYNVTNSSQGKVGIQFGGWPDYTFGGVFGSQFTYDGNTLGDLTVDLRRSNTDSNVTETVRFKSNGAVGIGITNPSAILHVIGDSIISTNLTVSGTLQSPITSLLSVSCGNVESNKMDKTLIGTTTTTMNNQLATFLGTTWTNFSLNEMGVSTVKFQKTLGEKLILYQDTSGIIGLGVTNGNMIIHSNDNVTDVSIGCNSSGGTFVGYREIVNVKASNQSLNVLGNIGTSGGTYQISGTDVLTSSTLGNGIVNSSLLSLGSTGSNPTFNTGDNCLLNSGTVNSYLSFRSTSSNNTFIGVLTNDMFLRVAKSASKINFQNSSASNIFVDTSSTNSHSLLGSLTLNSSQMSVITTDSGFDQIANFQHSNRNNCYIGIFSTGTNGELKIGLDSSDNSYLKAIGSNLKIYANNGSNETLRVEANNVIAPYGSMYANSYQINSSIKLKENITTNFDYSSIFDNVKFVQYNLK